MQPTIETLHSFYAERMGGPLPDTLLPSDQPLYWQGQTLFSTAQTAEPAYLLQSTIDSFLSEAPLGYFSVGFWGHGMNSHAFYYQRREPWCSLFLRLAYGGFYDDNERAAGEIRATTPWVTPSFGSPSATARPSKATAPCSNAIAGRPLR
ncbi:hypothetical protein [Cyanobium gracile]|uniref:Uncharacterized protein n=1 Tax=Cyanobium gracile UHCC 0281 TaxID=3110309 RepID=A0ABU5SWK6_9CYAN|nr:hypothetical protein [Cyanobium gracile]MEA5442841.1 hypothetical protein [Cyanobium gracile UHCC 0281]